MGWRADNELQQMLRESANAYLSDAGGPAHFRDVRSSASGFDQAAWRQMAELGWTGVLLPEAFGGAELGLEPALTLAEELGRSISPEPFVASAIIAATLLAAGGGETAKALATSLAQGERSVTLAWQEERGTIGAPTFSTRLSDGQLSGRKIHVPAWHEGSALLVAASGPDGPVVVSVDPEAVGVVILSGRATDGTTIADISFDGVAIPSDAMIVEGTAAQSALDLAIARGTIALSAQLEGLAGTLWHMTLDYMKQRSQFGTVLSDFQALRHQMVNLYSSIELAAASWRKAAQLVENGKPSSAAVHAAKARCNQAAQDMARWAVQYHGAFGYTDEADVGLFVHCALRWSSWLGNAPAHRRAALVAYGEEGR